MSAFATELRLQQLEARLGQVGVSENTGVPSFGVLIIGILLF